MALDEAQPVIPGSLKRFKVTGFRRLVDVDVELGPFNVLIGPNGGGKTSFLDAIEMTARALRRELKPFFNELGGFSQVIASGGDSISVYADLHAEYGHFAYGLTCVPAGYGHKLSSESLNIVPGEFAQQGPLVHSSTFMYYSFDGESVRYFEPGTPPRKLNSLVDESPLMEYPDPNLTTLSKLRGVATCPSIFTGRRSPIRSAQRLSPISYHSVDGDQLCVRLFDIQQGEPEIFEMVSRNLKLAFPNFSRLAIRLVANSHAGLFWHETGQEKPFEAGQLSDGVLRFLWLLSILYHPDCPPTILLDEPESHFHPRLIQILVEIFRECSAWTQVIVATHSPTIVRFIKPHELLVMEDDEQGIVRLRSASNLNLSHWLEDFTLDEIWSLGRLSDN